MPSRTVLLIDRDAHQGPAQALRSHFEALEDNFGPIDLRCFDHPDAVRGFLATDLDADVALIGPEFGQHPESPTGFDVARDLAASFPRVPRVLYGGTGRALSLLPEFQRSSFFHYLPRDADRAEVVQCVRAAFQYRDSLTSSAPPAGDPGAYDDSTLRPRPPGHLARQAIWPADEVHGELVLDALPRRALVFSPLTHERARLTRALRAADYDVVEAGTELTFRDRLLNWQPTFVLLSLGLSVGAPAYAKLCDLVERARGLVPHLHMALVHNGELPVNPALLPAGVSSVDVDTLESPRLGEQVISDLHAESCRLATFSSTVQSVRTIFFQPRGAPEAAQPERWHRARSVLQRCKTEGRGLVTINVKHPLMVPALMLAAQKARAPICLEVSPLEAQQHWLRLIPSLRAGGWPALEPFGPSALKPFLALPGGGVSPHPMVQVRGTLELIRSLIDHYAGVLSCRQEVLLHLDHATKLDLIQGGVDAGCDLVMFDGTAFDSLATNIATTAEVKKLFGQGGLVVEGEIDRKDRPTLPVEADAVRRFLRETSADLLGIWAGQQHGTNYDFESYIKRALELEQLDGRDVRGGDLPYLMRAIDELQREYHEKGYSEHGFARVFLGQLRQCLAVESHEENARLLAYAITGDRVVVQAPERAATRLDLKDILASAHQLWHPDVAALFDRVQERALMGRLERRREIGALRKRQLESLISVGEHTTFPLQLGALEAYQSVREEFPDFLGFVLHGSSSIDRDQLDRSRALGVVKANFGSSVYQYFVESLDGLWPGLAPSSTVSEHLEGRKDLLRTFWTSQEWRSPDYLRRIFQRFADVVVEMYFKPMGWAR